MVQLGYSVRFLLAQHLANAVVSATSRSEIARLLDPLIKCDLLILDEFGYLTVEPQVGPVLYEIIACTGYLVHTINKSTFKSHRSMRKGERRAGCEESAS
jgi:DNA replication protein DnaC